MNNPGRARRIWRVLWRLAVVVIVLVVVAVAIATEGFASFGARAQGARLVRIEASPEHKDGAFHNTHTTSMMRDGESQGALREWFTGTQVRSPTTTLPLWPHGEDALRTPPASGLRITWLGHSTTLLEVDGLRVLTDPQWSERASPSQWLGPKRFHPPPIALDALGHIDVVLVSHDHYDHCDMHTLQALAHTADRFVVPLGIGAHLESWGVDPARITELDWWSDVVVNGVKLVSTPAQHFSGRGLWHRDDTLWTSWSIVGPTHRVFFSGDTGLTDDLDDIAKREGPFDVALLEIGQHHPSWGDIHLGPKNALVAFHKVHARMLLPIHWGTFELALHGWSEPAESVFVDAAAQGISLLTPMLGQPVEPDGNAETARTPWWRDVR